MYAVQAKEEEYQFDGLPKLNAHTPSFSYHLTLHEPRVIAKTLHECFAHKAVLLEGTLEGPRH